MIGDNVTSDFLDNLGAEQYRKMHKETDDIIVNMDGGVGGSWKVNKITPETYEKMNEEFEEEGMAFRIIVPTQDQIDEWEQKWLTTTLEELLFQLN